LLDTDEKIIAMREALDAPKFLIDMRLKTDGGSSMVLDDHGVEIFYEDSSFFDGTDNGVYGNSDLVFSGVTFKRKSQIPLPFGIKTEESLDVVCEKMGREQDYNNDSLPQKVWKVIRQDGKIYLIYCYFTKDYSMLRSLNLFTYTEELEELLAS
jgi:hypothetical protein